MGVQLNIKDQRTVELARMLAEQLGKSVTETIREALEEKRLAREGELQRKVAEVKTLLGSTRQYLDPEWQKRSLKDIMDSIYDEDGSPA